MDDGCWLGRIYETFTGFAYGLEGRCAERTLITFLDSAPKFGRQQWDNCEPVLQNHPHGSSASVLPTV